MSGPWTRTQSRSFLPSTLAVAVQEEHHRPTARRFGVVAGRQVDEVLPLAAVDADVTDHMGTGVQQTRRGGQRFIGGQRAFAFPNNPYDPLELPPLGHPGRGGK